MKIFSNQNFFFSRHNLSLHDIFVREEDEKNSTWSLRKEPKRQPLTFETVLAREQPQQQQPLQDITAAQNFHQNTLKNSSRNFLTPEPPKYQQSTQFSPTPGPLFPPEPLIQGSKGVIPRSPLSYWKCLYDYSYRIISRFKTSFLP